MLRLRRRSDARSSPVGEGREPFYRVVQAAFRQRRKQIHNGLARELPISAATTSPPRSERVGSSRERRPQTLTLGEWACLAERLGDRP